jgi:hypothetical protein
MNQRVSIARSFTATFVGCDAPCCSLIGKFTHPKIEFVPEQICGNESPMRHTGLALAALLLVSQSARVSSEDRPKVFLVGTYLGNEMQPDGEDQNAAAMHRTYYVRTEEGTWSLVSYNEAADVIAHTLGWTPLHLKNEKPNTLDNLKHGDKFAFRVEADHRIGATKTSFHVYIPRADDPKKEDKFDADFTPIPTPAAAAATPTDNVKAMCEAHRFSPEQEKQFCETAQELPVNQSTKN